MGGLDIVVFPVTVLADDQRHIGGIPFDGVVQVYLDILLLQLGLELVCTVLAGIVGDDHAAHIESLFLELIPQTQHVHIIGDPQVTTDLVLLNVRSTDDDDDLGIVRKLHQHLEFGIRCKSGKYPGGMVVIEQFPAKFQVELVPELADPLLDMLRLHF